MQYHTILHRFWHGPWGYAVSKQPQCTLIRSSVIKQQVIWYFVCSLMPRPHPAHARRRRLVSQVQILGLAPEAWSTQSNHKMRKQEQVLQTYRSNRVIRFIIQHQQFVILQLQGFNTSASPNIQACDTRPFPHQRVGSGHKTTFCEKRHM